MARGGIRKMCIRDSPQGWRKHLPKAVKRTVPLPVVSVALIRDPAYGEKLLEEGVLDFVASARSHLADPDWGNKARQGREEEILPCISCMACFGKYEQAGHITCAVNPETGYEAQLPPLPRDGEGRLVVVLGGGPAGLELSLIHIWRRPTRKRTLPPQTRRQRKKRPLWNCEPKGAFLRESCFFPREPVK